MFLDNRQVAMDSALEALADSLDYFQDNSDRLRPAIRNTLKPLYAERGEAMRELQSLVRKHLSMLPRDADVERDDYMWLWSRIKSFVSNDSAVLLGELLEQERVLMQALATVLTHSLDEELEVSLERCWKNCRGLIREITKLQQQ